MSLTLRRRLLLSVLPLVAPMLSLATGASPADAQAPPTYLVTTTADLPGTTCGPTCSLRQAINAATANGTSTIGFGVDGVFKLTRGTPLVAKQAGTPPRPGQSLTIEGNGTGKTIIGGRGVTRVLRIDAGADVTLSDLTIRNGKTSGNGGGISNLGTLTLSGAKVSGNTAGGNGGGIYNYGQAQAGTPSLTLTGSLVTRNSAALGGGIRNAGGGVLTLAATAGSTPVLSSVTKNNATVRGGGISNRADSSVGVTGSTIANNSSAGGGGGIATKGPIRVESSTVSGNRSVHRGGGVLILAGSNAVLQYIQVTNNAVTGAGNGDDGGGIANLGTLTLAKSQPNATTALTGNSAGHDGGGLANKRGASANVAETTITGNHAGKKGGGIANIGKSASGTPSKLAIAITPITSNSAGKTGGGIYSPVGTPAFKTSPVTNNTPNNCAPVTSAWAIGANTGCAPNSGTGTDTPPAPSPTAPQLTSAAVNASSLTLVYSSSLDGESVPAPTDYTVVVDGVADPVNAVSVSNSTLQLALSFPVFQFSTVTLSYTAGAHPVRSSAGVLVANLTNQPVTNQGPPGPPPTVTITSAPTNPTTSTAASFSFSSSAPGGVTFECSLDGSQFTSCTSPKTYTGLAKGSHSFQVNGTDKGGNTGGPANYTWQIN